MPEREISILLVEDHVDTAAAMGRLLNRIGYGVKTATTVAAALDVAERENFDLIISDIGLPDGTGLDLMRQLLQRKPIKGIVLSGYGMEDDLRASQEAGFVEHLIKPVNFDQLQQAIRRAVGEN